MPTYSSPSVADLGLCHLTDKDSVLCCILSPAHQLEATVVCCLIENDSVLCCILSLVLPAVGVTVVCCAWMGVTACHWRPAGVRHQSHPEGGDGGGRGQPAQAGLPLQEVALQEEVLRMLPGIAPPTSSPHQNCMAP